jgi:hypothetical protein
MEHMVANTGCRCRRFVTLMSWSGGWSAALVGILASIDHALPFSCHCATTGQGQGSERQSTYIRCKLTHWARRVPVVGQQRRVDGGGVSLAVHQIAFRALCAAAISRHQQ